MPTVSNRCLRSVGVVSVSPQSWLALNRFLGPKGFSRHRIETNYLPSVASNQTHGSVPILPRVNIGGVWFRALNCFVATQSIFQGKGCNTQFVKIHSGMESQPALSCNYRLPNLSVESPNRLRSCTPIRSAMLKYRFVNGLDR